MLWTVERTLPRFMMTSSRFWHTTGTFYRGEVIRNPRWHERLVAALRAPMLRWLQAA